MSLRLMRCSDVWRYRVLGVGGLGVRSRGGASGAAKAACCRVGGALGGALGGAEVALGGVISTGSGNGSILIFRRGTRSLEPAGRPLLRASGCAGFSGASWGGFSGGFSGVFGSSTVFSGIVAGSSVIFENSKHFSIDGQCECYILKRMYKVIVPVSELKGQALCGRGRDFEVN
jgi:hypothetical protein